jgi:WD40 repeat protein
MGANTLGVLQVWDLETGKPTRQEFVPRTMHPSCMGANVYSFSASEDGSILAASLSCGFGVVWRQGDPAVVVALSNHQDEYKLRNNSLPSTSKIVLSADGKMGAYGMVFEPSMRILLLNIFDVESGQVLAGVNPIDVNVITAQMAPNKDLMLSGVGSQVLVWWPEAFVWGGNNLKKLTEHKVIVTALGFSTKGEYLATGDYGGRTILWQAK